MKSYIGWVLLVVCLVVTYQGWQTSHGFADTQDRARSVACDIGRKDCVLAFEQPAVVKADFMHRKYEFKTSHGPVTVTCSREWVVFGNFNCAAHLGSLPTG